MQYIILVLLIVLALKFQTSKKIAFLNIAFMWIIISLNYNNPDYNNYLRIYNNPEIISDFGFSVLCKAFNGLHLSYNCMLGFISSICLLLLYKTFKRMSDKVALVTMLYMLYPFFADAIQIRNFIAMSIVLYAMKFINNRHEKKDLILYIIFVLLASSFHILALVYLALPIINKFSIKLNILFGVLGSMLILGLIRIVGIYFPRMDEYNDEVVFWKAFIYMLPFIVLFAVGEGLYLNNKRLEYSMNRFFVKSQIYLFMYNILLFVNLNYHRIFRNFIPILDVGYAELFQSKLSKKRFFMLLCLIGAILIKFFWGWNEKELLMQNNYLFDFLGKS